MARITVKTMLAELDNSGVTPNVITFVKQNGELRKNVRVVKGYNPKGAINGDGNYKAGIAYSMKDKYAMVLHDLNKTRQITVKIAGVIFFNNMEVIH